MNPVPNRQVIAKALLDGALADNDNEVVYTGQYRAVYALRAECYKLRIAARALGNRQYDVLKMTVVGAKDPSMAILTIGRR